MKLADSFEKPMSSEQAARLKALAEMPDSEIDYSDIPALTDEQLANFRPARDFEQFRRWQDQHHPEMVEAFEEARRRWHERNDPPKG